MRCCLLFLICQAALALGQANLSAVAPQPHQQHDAKEAAQLLVGAWQLVSVETVRPNGEVVYPFYGKHPQGLIVYDPAGWMSVQIVSDPQPTVPTTDSRQAFLDAPQAEKLAAVDGFYAYYGTWTVDASGATVAHHILESLYPGERGEVAVRQISIQGDRLTLVARIHEMGEDRQRRITWERLSPTAH